jgi:hypothetical protein
MSNNLRADLFKTVMVKRKKASNIAPLLEFAVNTDHAKAATQALNAARASCEGTDASAYLDNFLTLLKETSDNNIRLSAEKGAATIISNASNKKKFGKIIMDSYKTAMEDTTKYAFLRLLATTGGDEAAKVVTEALHSNSKPMNNAAIAALGKWVNDEQFETLTDFITETDDTGLRRRAFDAAYNFLRLPRDRDPDDEADLWRSLAATAKTAHEKLQIIRGMSVQDSKWALEILEPYIQDSDDLIIDKAEQAKDRVERSIRDKK